MTQPAARTHPAQDVSVVSVRTILASSGSQAAVRFPRPPDFTGHAAIMKSSFIAVGLALAFGGAQALTLDFGNGPSAPNICSAAVDGSGAFSACSDFGYINQAYGDVAGVVDVTYSQPSSSSSSSPLSLRWWSTGYNDLYGVLWSDGSDASSHARIELKPLGGDVVTLTAFDFGAYN